MSALAWGQGWSETLTHFTNTGMQDVGLEVARWPPVLMAFHTRDRAPNRTFPSIS